MGKAYNDLIFQLGDLARERLATRTEQPRSMQRVLKAEEVLIARREELEALEAEMNQEDLGYQEFLREQESEKVVRQEVVKQFRRAVEAVDSKVKDARKRLSRKRSEVAYGTKALVLAEQRHAAIEQQGEPNAISVSHESLKRLRIAHMRHQRDVEEVQRELEQLLTPRAGQPGAEGLLAHKRLMEMEDEAHARKEETDARLAELDQAIGIKEEEVKAAEDYLDQALFLLGEECYKERIADPALAALYPKIEKAK